MSKNSLPKKAEVTIDLAVEVRPHPVDEDVINNFIQERNGGDPKAQGSLMEYIQEKFYKGQQVIVVPDLSDERFEGMNLAGIDFSGCKLTGAWFQLSNLKGAIFTDSDLAEVTFFDCKMQNVDMRGADLSGCLFGTVDSEMDPEKTNAKFEGMKFSSTEGLLSSYIDKNEEIIKEQSQAFEKDKQEEIEAQQVKIDAKQEEINQAYSKLSYYAAGRANIGLASNNVQYDKLVADQAKLVEKKGELEKLSFTPDNKKYVIDPSLVQVMGAQRNFDPGYIRGQDKASRDQVKQYVRLTREDVASYLEARKANPDLELNEFAKQQMAAKGMEFQSGAKVVADLSSKKLPDGSNERIDLSGLDFTGAKLQEACFSGAKMRGCNFKEANLNNAIFESADITQAKFEKTSARDTNFFYCDMQSASIKNCDFKRAFMRGSNATDAKIEAGNFDYANIKYGKWNGVKIDTSTFNYADLEGVALAGADMRRVQMQHAILDKAIMSSCSIIESDLKGTYLEKANLAKAKIENTILDGITANGVNLSDAELDNLCSLEGVDLENAILNRMKAEGVKFVQVNMDGVEAEFANFKNAQLEGVTARFANLEGAILENAKASGVDMTGAKLTDIKAKGVDLSKAVLEGIEAQRADFTGGNLSEANLRGSKLEDAIMVKVNARKADLRNAEAAKLNLEGAEVEGLKVNEGTDLHGAKTKGATGTLEQHGVDGKVTEIKLEDKVKLDDKLHVEKQKSKISVVFGNVMKSFGGVVEKIGGIIRQPCSTKWGRIIGAVAGGVAVAAIAFSAIVTMGGSLAVIAAGVAIAAGVGAASGAVAGHFAAKKMSALHVVGGIVGASVGLAPGAIAGVVAVEALDRTVKNFTGKTATEHLASGVESAGKNMQKMGESLGRTQEVEQQLLAQEQAKQAYKAVEQTVQVEHGVDRSEVRLRMGERARQEEQGLVPPVPSLVLREDVSKGPTTAKQTAIDIGIEQQRREESRETTPNPTIRPKVPEGLSI